MNRFLIVRLGSLGDVVHGIPVAAALRVRFPAARIDWLTDPRYVELLGLVRGIDQRIPIDTRRVGEALATLRTLRAARYDAAIDLQGLIKSAVLARAAGGRQTIGFPRAHARESAASLFYTDTPDPGDATHVVFKNLALLEALGIRDIGVEFPLDLPPSAAADTVRAQAGVSGYAIINPGAAWPNKRWPPARFGTLATFIRDRLGLTPVVLWGPGEHGLASAVAVASGGAARVAPPTAIADVFALAKGARLVVSGDTGPLHIGAAVGTPIVALFGPTWPERNGPWAASDVTLSQNAQCSCHYERRCRRGDPCINAITLDEVAAAVERRIATHG